MGGHMPSQIMRGKTLVTMQIMRGKALVTMQIMKGETLVTMQIMKGESTCYHANNEGGKHLLPCK